MFCLIFTVKVSSAVFICENEAKFALIWSKDCATGVNRSIGYSVFTTEEKNIITYRTAKAICIRECLNVNFPCSQKGRWFYNAGDNLFLSKWVLFCRFFAFKNHNGKIELIMS